MLGGKSAISYFRRARARAEAQAGGAPRTHGPAVCADSRRGRDVTHVNHRGVEACWRCTMAWLLCLIRLCLAFLLVSCSAELNQDLSVGRKLCGSNLLREILLLCGKADWSQFPCRRKPSGLPGPLPSPKPPGPSRGEVETEVKSPHFFSGLLCWIRSFCSIRN